MMRKFLLTVLISMLAGGAGAAEIKVFCPGAVRSVVAEPAQAFQRSSGHSVKLEYGTAGAVAKRVAAGDIGDVAITTASSLAKLAEEGRIIADSRRDLGKVGVAVAVRSGATLPDISTPDAFKRAMLGAKSVMYADPALGGQSGIHAARVFEKLGIAEAMKPKTMLRPGAPQGLVEVANGDIEIGIGQMSEIVAAKGVRVAGPLPGELQNTLTFSAGIVGSTKAAGIAREFIGLLVSPGAREKFKAAGFDLPE